MNKNTIDHLILQAEQLRTSGCLVEAECAFQKILQLDQKNFDAWQGLARIMQKKRCINEALECLVRANAIKPSASLDSKISKIVKKWSSIKKGKLYQQLALFQMGVGNAVDSVKSIQKTLSFNPGNEEALYYLSRFLVDVRFTSNIDKTTRLNLIRALESKVSDKQFMVHAVTSALKCEPAFSKFLNTVLNGNLNFDLSDPGLKKILSDDLLVAMLTTALVTDQEIESLMTALRKEFLGYVIKHIDVKPEKYIDGLGRFVCALAAQCFNNEYVFYVTEQEDDWLNLLVSIIDNCSYSEISPLWYAVVAAYKPLIELRNADKLAAKDWGEPWDQLISFQVRNFLIENSLKLEISVLTDVQNSVSLEVQEQYEDNPFPRWLYLPMTNHDDSIETYIKKQLPQLDFSQDEHRSPEILIAGCGTGLIPCIYASTFPRSKILAVDLSRASLAYGKRMASEFGLTNIKFLQGDILALGCLDRKFDFINCYGVLHHTGNILKSWQVLRGLLKDDGFMEIGLYSAIARQSVSEVRDYIAKSNYSATQDGMRQCRQDLLKTNNPLFQQVVNAWAFYSMSNFRDLAFHVHEICINIDDLEKLIAQLSLKFMGFSLEHPESKLLYQALYPDDSTMTALKNWQVVEEKHPTTFENCYKFWVCPISSDV